MNLANKPPLGQKEPKKKRTQSFLTKYVKGNAASAKGLVKRKYHQQQHIILFTIDMVLPKDQIVKLSPSAKDITKVYGITPRLLYTKSLSCGKRLMDLTGLILSKKQLSKAVVLFLDDKTPSWR